MAKGYIIKEIFLNDDKTEDKSREALYLKKGGRCAQTNEKFFDFEVYKDYRTARSVATKLKNHNDKATEHEIANIQFAREVLSNINGYKRYYEEKHERPISEHQLNYTIAMYKRRLDSIRLYHFCNYEVVEVEYL